MLSIRLSRVGTKRRPVYRVVVMPKNRDPWADVTEILGHYNPRKNPRELVVKVDRVKYWIENGAEATDTVWNLLVDEKIVEGKKRGVTTLSNKRREKMEKTAEAEKTKAAEAKAKAEAEAAAKAAAEAEAKAAAQAPTQETPAEAPAEEKAE